MAAWEHATSEVWLQGPTFKDSLHLRCNAEHTRTMDGSRFDLEGDTFEENGLLVMDISSNTSEDTNPEILDQQKYTKGDL